MQPPTPKQTMNEQIPTQTPIPQPIIGDKMTDQQREACLEEIRGALATICQNAGNDLAQWCFHQAKKLTNAELLEITRGHVQHTRAARVLLVVTGPERILSQWDAESIKRDVKRTRRALKNRY